MKYNGNGLGMSKSKFRLVKTNEDFTPLMKRIKNHIDESKFNSVICLN
ncbi:hypothetical protein [Flagellimonas nanhaiensis]|nr:hypothetical protein [Allomuricauda nanhaiensis]